MDICDEEETQNIFKHNVEPTFYHCNLTSQYQAHYAQQKLLRARKQSVVPAANVGANNDDDSGDPGCHLTRTLVWRAAVSHAKERVDPTKYYSAKLYGDFVLDGLSERLAQPEDGGTLDM